MAEKEKKQKSKLAVFMFVNGITQEELSEATGIKQSHISRIVSGDIKNITLKSAYKISRALNCMVEDIFSEEEMLNQ